MSYLEALMKNDPPEGEGRQVFVKCKQPEKIIVHVQHQTDNNSQESSTVESSEETTRKTEKTRKTFKNKNSLRKGKKKSSSGKGERKPRDPNYSKAFEIAQKELLKNCLPSKDDDAIISQSIQYIHNWNGHHIHVNVSDDNQNVKVEEKDYSFSKKRFLSNRNFQRMIIDEYNKAYGNTYLRFYQSRKNEDSYTIHVKAGR